MEQLDHLLGIDGDTSDINLNVAEHKPQSPLTQAFLFNRWFITTYQWCLLVITFSLAARHWLSIVRRAKRARRGQTPDDAAKVGHFQALKDAASEPSTDRERVDESTLLLVGDASHMKVSIRHIVTRRVRALLMIHPTFIRDVPGNDTSLFVLLVFGLNIFYAVYNAPIARATIFAWADRTGLLFVANLPWLYFLSAKNQPFRLLTGTSYEGLNILHRGLGKWLAILAVLHTVSMTVVWYDFLLPRGLDFWWYLSQNIIWLGLAAFACYEILCTTSLIQFRQWWYEMFLACHIVLQAGGLAFLFFHHHGTRTYVGIALAIFLIDRLVYRLILKTRSFTADLAVLEDGQTVMVSASWQMKRWTKLHSWLMPRDVGYGWSATDHVFLTVPALSAKHRIQAHPFTIASAAPAADDTHAWLNLIIRARDGFTKDLLEHAALHSTATVRLDGPYGSSHVVDMLLESEASIIVAGGSGIAVAFPIVWRLLHDTRRCNTKSQTCLIWIVNDSRHIEWIGHERLDELRELGLIVVIPPPTVKAGRPDVAILLADNIRELTHGDPNHKSGVVVSGPDAMNRAVRNACARMAWQGMNIDVAVEVFDW